MKSGRSKQKPKLLIKGIEWSYILLSTEDYKKKHNNDGSAASCASFEKLIRFRPDLISLPVVIHEITHAYVYSCCVGSTSDISQDDMEEIFCEINAYHLEEILAYSKKVYKELLCQKKRLKRP